LEARARAYLHANCGHCHSEHGGGSVPLRLKFPTPIAAMNAVGVRPTRGDFGLPDARIVKPSDPYASTMYFRMAKFGRDRMPHIGSEQPDEAALRLIAEWIAGLDGKTPKADPAKAVATNLANPTSAQILARKLGRGEVGAGERAALLAEAAKLQPGPIRDLFEGYLPSDDRKKLGSNPRPREILALAGDHGRGEKLFWSQTNRCGTCHRVGERGTAVGPDLSTIGSLRPREAILESLLELSRRVEPQYAAFAVATTDGASLTGLVINRDEKGMTLRDAQGKDVVLKAEDVEEVRPSRVSLMPDGQLAELTAQEAADLLAYLASLKK
jgi:putative heme-binding domain-containing protein